MMSNKIIMTKFHSEIKDTLNEIITILKNLVFIIYPINECVTHTIHMSISSQN